MNATAVRDTDALTGGRHLDIQLEAAGRALTPGPSKTAFNVEIWRVPERKGDIVNAAPNEHHALGWFTLGKSKSVDLADHEYRASQ
ncbi:hypothetical protein [Salinibacterium sp. TMP30]|uniref:hypothetical protein n=1 Tax=Salinibacterium sp. TMP30 TaxID=3138237 RepID=UPI00313A242D